MSLAETMERRAEEFKQRYTAIQEQIGRVIVGHDEIVHGVLTCLLVGGHCLLEGVPGLGKTLLVRTLAQVLDLDFSHPVHARPDAGRHSRHQHGHGNGRGKRFFEFQRGPIFTQICLADEINRATPKTQSAMLETMQEGASHRRRHPLPVETAVPRHGHAEPDRAGGDLLPCRKPNSDRSLLLAGSATSIATSLRQSSTAPRGTRRSNRRRSWTGKKSSAGRVLCARSSWPTTLRDYLVRLVLATHPEGVYALPSANKFIRWGESPSRPGRWHWPPRSGCLDGRYNVSFEDIRRVYLPALPPHHRQLRVQAEGIQPDQILLELLEQVPEKDEG